MIRRLQFGVLLLAAAAQGQGPPAAERIEVNIIELTAVVRDGAGKPVTGLRSSDFELHVDGQPRPITNFYEVKRPSGSASSQVVADDASPTARRDYLVLFIDELHLEQHEKMRALDALRHFVRDRVRLGTAAMLVQSNGDVRILQKFSEDPAAITRAIDELERQPAHGMELEAEMRAILRFVADARKAADEDNKAQDRGKGRRPPADLGPLARQQMESFARHQRDEAESTVAALNHVIHIAQGLDGRRALVYVSDGLPLQAGAEVFQSYKADEFLVGEPKPPRSKDDEQAPNTAPLAVARILAQNQQGDAMATNLNATYIDLAHKAALAGVQFFAINARGVQGFGQGAEGAAPSTLDSSLIRANTLGPIKLLADETGGEAIVDMNDLNLAFARLDEDLSNYYSIGFRSEGSDRESSIKLVVKRRGMTVYATRRLKQQTASEQIADRVRAALYAPLKENPLDADVSLGPLSDNAGLRVTVRVPVAGLSILPHNGTSGAAFTVYVTMMDEQMRETPVRMFMHRITAAELEESVHSLRLEAPPGKYLVSLAIADAFSSTASYLQQEITIGR